MSNEATIQVSIRIYKTDTTDPTIVLLDENRSAGYSLDVEGSKGPTPGSFTIPTAGVSIDLSELVNHGLVWIHNQSPTYKVAIGIKDPDSGNFFPMLEFLPGMRLPLYLSEDVGEQYSGSGTATGTANNTLFAKAFGGPATLQVLAYER